MSMLWQRFTERAKRVVIAAQEEAAYAGEPYVSPEHLLLGMVKENDSVATKVLERLSVAASRVREDIERQIGTRGYGRLNNNDVTLDPRMKRVLDFSYDEARQSNTNYIGTEHLLLGIIREGDGIAFRTLSKHGIDIVVARREVVAYLGGEVSPPWLSRTAPSPSAGATPASRGSLTQLVTYQVQQFADPDKATAWLNECARAGFRFTHSSAAPTGEIWIVVEAPVTPAQIVEALADLADESAITAAPDEAIQGMGSVLLPDMPDTGATPTAPADEDATTASVASGITPGESPGSASRGLTPAAEDRISENTGAHPTGPNGDHDPTP